MQKVEGSSPFIRFPKRPAKAGLLHTVSCDLVTASTTRVYQTRNPVGLDSLFAGVVKPGFDRSAGATGGGSNEAPTGYAGQLSCRGLDQFAGCLGERTLEVGWSRSTARSSEQKFARACPLLLPYEGPLRDFFRTALSGRLEHRGQPQPSGRGGPGRRWATARALEKNRHRPHVICESSKSTRLLRSALLLLPGIKSSLAPSPRTRRGAF